jgi:hypothetical protein
MLHTLFVVCRQTSNVQNPRVRSFLLGALFFFWFWSRPLPPGGHETGPVSFLTVVAVVYVAYAAARLAVVAMMMMMMMMAVVVAMIARVPSSLTRTKSTFVCREYVVVGACVYIFCPT